MTETQHTYLGLASERTSLSSQASAEVVVAVGVDRVADDIFLHEPPTPVELERAIEVVEDALMATGLRHDERGDLATSDPRLRALFGPMHGSTRVTIQEVEALFQRLASVSLGDRSQLAGRTVGRKDAAALLILRECMHHLGFRAVWV